MAFIRQRFFHQRYQIGLLLGFAIVIAHVLLGQLEDAANWLDGVHLLNPAISEWIIFDFRNSFSDIFLFSLPILCSLGSSLALTEDLRSGFVDHLTQFSFKRYLSTNLGVTFFSGFLTGALPILLDYFLSIWFFPNRTPDLITGYGANPTETYALSLFYEQPFLLMLVYLTLIGVTCGIFSLISAFSGIISRNLYIAMSFPLVLVIILTVASDFLPNFIYTPIYFLFGNSPRNLPPLGWLIAVYFIIVIGLILGIWHELKVKITI